MSIRNIELLAPARDLDCGVAAIRHGADAVYIGGPRFSARAAAANSLRDLEKLVAEAHLFHAKVYVAMNTVLNDRELEDAVGIAWQLNDIGVDGLIIQDMGLLECELPPIPLHASTQVNNRTPEKVAFLEQVGFRQVVLARELSLPEIRAIRAATTVTLECFVHGALCVSYSGQCYISEVVAGRSANRGECAQFCRHRYTLRDNRGRVLAKDRYLLSLKDLDLSDLLPDLIGAGVDSFKIEGRLKDQNYVKNVTAFYRETLDEIIERDSGLARAASGRCTFPFVPDPERSFSRGRTEYFLKKKRNSPGAVDSPKSLGKKLGRVIAAERKFFILEADEQVNNGDGLCFFDPTGRLIGLKVNRVTEDGKIYPREPVDLPLGVAVWRNSDIRFTRLLEASDNCRTIVLRLSLREVEDALVLTVTDEDGVTSETRLAVEKETARLSGSASLLAARQLKKSGGTVFTVAEAEVRLSDGVFYPAAAYNELRRLALGRHEAARLASHIRLLAQVQKNEVPWPGGRVDYRDNIVNEKAEAFYRRHGVCDIDRSELRAEQLPDCALMTTRYCIRAQLGLCPKDKSRSMADPIMSLSLSDNTGDYRLEFDCRRCGMTVRRGKPLGK